MRVEVLSLLLLQLTFGAIGSAFDEITENNLKDLESLKAHPDLKSLRTNGAKLIEQACLLGNLEVVKYLLSAGALLFVPEDCQVLEAAIDSGSIELVDLLVRNGANPKSLSAIKIGDLAINGDFDMISYLCEHGYDLNSDPFEILDSAVIAGDQRIVKLILENNVKLSIAEFSVVGQRAVQMGRFDIFTLILATLEYSQLKTMIEYAINSGNVLMTNHVLLFIQEHKRFFAGLLWAELYTKALNLRRSDIAGVILTKLNTHDLVTCLNKIIELRGNSSVFFSIIENVDNLPEAIESSPTLAFNLITSAIVSDQPKIIEVVLKTASVAALSKCCTAIRHSHQLSYLVKILEMENATDVLLFDVAETIACYHVAYDTDRPIAERILKLVDGTQCSAKLLSKIYYKGGEERVQTFLMHSPNIKTALNRCRSSGDEIYKFACHHEDDHMKCLSFSGISGEIVLANLHSIWKQANILEEEKVGKCESFLDEVKRESVVNAYDLEQKKSSPSVPVLKVLQKYLGAIKEEVGDSK